MTGVVQSSSAADIATIGFVNAGIADPLLRHSASSHGAIRTTGGAGWGRSGGFYWNVECLRRPHRPGMLGRVFGSSPRICAMGEALAGFGLFFIGIDFLNGIRCLFHRTHGGSTLARLAARRWSVFPVCIRHDCGDPVIERIHRDHADSGHRWRIGH